MREFRIALLLIWGLGAIAGFLFAQLQHIPRAVALAAGAAFLLELSFYLANGFEAVRRRAAGLGPLLPACLMASAVLPYSVYAAGAGLFRWQSFALLAGLAAVAVFWYRLLPHSGLTDLLFLAWMAGVYLARPFGVLYPTLVEDLRAEALGQLMWIRIGIAAVLLFRPMPGIGFGFLPTGREWKVGLRYFLCFAPPGCLLLLALRFARFEPVAGLWWKAPATFLGILWVVALGEEFFFRGLLLQRLSAWFGAAAGLVLSSLLFGASHLTFREFPNWKFAALASVAGIFYGLAFRAGGGIRAAMVSHALTVTAWRSLFQ